jgi:hypothetical protein
MQIWRENREQFLIKHGFFPSRRPGRYDLYCVNMLEPCMDLLEEKQTLEPLSWQCGSLLAMPCRP